MTIKEAEEAIKRIVGCNEPGAHCMDCEHIWKFRCMMRMAEQIDKQIEKEVSENA